MRALALWNAQYICDSHSTSPLVMFATMSILFYSGSFHSLARWKHFKACELECCCSTRHQEHFFKACVQWNKTLFAHYLLTRLVFAWVRGIVSWWFDPPSISTFKPTVTITPWRWGKGQFSFSYRHSGNFVRHWKKFMWGGPGQKTSIWLVI